MIKDLDLDSGFYFFHLGIFDLDGMRADRMRWDGLVDHTWRGEPHPTLGRHPHEFRLVEVGLSLR